MLNQSYDFWLGVSIGTWITLISIFVIIRGMKSQIKNPPSPRGVIKPYPPPPPPRKN
jgi:hypothetical protein